MKITKIRFKNINSFYGEHPCIDFGIHPLQSTGLFMISGPTGAGKSTLLDVISLALYNKIPRFAAKISIGQMVQHGSIINATAYDEPTTDAFAEVEYEVKGERYRSKWSVNKNRRNNWRNYSMEIAKLPSGELLDIKDRADFPKKNEELIGLNYNQFIQSILLAQGNFAEFLRASANDRSRLLEDITGTHIYRTIGMAAFRKNRVVQEAIKDAEKLVDGIEILPEEQRETYQTELLDNNHKVTEFQSKADFFRLQWEAKKQHRQAHSDLATVQMQQAAWQEKQRAFQPDAEKLSRHAVVADLAKPLSDYENAVANCAKNQRYLAEITRDKEQQNVQVQIMLERASATFRCEFLAVNFEEKLDDCKNKIKGIDRKKDALKSAGTASLQTIENTISQTKDGLLSRLHPKNYDDNILQLEAYKNQLTTKKSTIEERDADKLESLDVLKSDLSKWIEKCREIEKLTKQGQDEKLMRSELAGKLKMWVDKLKIHTTESDKAMEELEVLKQEKDNKRNHADLKKMREELTDDEPCPVCGSTQHPYREHVIRELGGLEVKLLSQEKLVNDCARIINEVNTEIKVTESKIESCDKQLLKLREEYTLVLGECKLLATTNNLPTDTPMQTLEMKLTEINDKRNQINEFIRQKSTLECIDLLRKLTQENQQRLKEFQELEEQKKKIYQGNDADADLAQISTEWTKISTHLLQLTKQVAQLNSTIAEASEDIEFKKEKLVKQLMVKGLTTIDVVKEQLLNGEDLQRMQQEKEELQREKTSLETQKKSLEEQLKKALEKISSLEPEDELAYKVNALTDAVNEANKKIGHLQTVLQTDDSNRNKQASQLGIIAKMKNDANKWILLNNYIGSATGDVFSNFAQNLTLNNLIALANLRLKHLSDRYLLGKMSGDSDSLRVVDLYQGHAERSVETLSGGETFTISLAMALALSDLASRNVKLESLFIDEGFGTLDAETLESAIGTLERLQHESKKTVGIISHRQELIDRISTQIKVQKNNDGKSSVEVVGF